MKIDLNIFFKKVHKSMCDKLGYSEEDAHEIITAIYIYAKTFGYPNQK